VSFPRLGNPSNVAQNAADVLLLAENTQRLGATFFNDATVTLYLLLGTSASSTTNYTVQVLAKGYYEVPYGYTGQVRGIWASAGSGAARVDELTP
jgi:hypothetical protein